MLYKEITESVKRNILPYQQEMSEKPDADFLVEFNRVWANHTLSLGMVSDISMYLDKNYVVKEKLKSIYDSGVLLFKKNIYKHKSIYSRFQNLIFEQIELERKGE